jgi:hypothetical protein
MASLAAETESQRARRLAKEREGRRRRLDSETSEQRASQAAQSATAREASSSGNVSGSRLGCRSFVTITTRTEIASDRISAAIMRSITEKSARRESSRREALSLFLRPAYIQRGITLKNFQVPDRSGDEPRPIANASTQNVFTQADGCGLALRPS